MLNVIFSKSPGLQYALHRNSMQSHLHQSYLSSSDYTALSILDASLMKLLTADYEKVLQGSVEMRVDKIIAVSCAIPTLHCIIPTVYCVITAVSFH